MPLRSQPSPAGKTIASIFEAVAEEHLIQPTSSMTSPLAVSPLSKSKPDDPDWVERFELYIGGMEVGNAFSELNDPEEQLRRFEDQTAARSAATKRPWRKSITTTSARSATACRPPAGEGIGIDRLTMMLTGSTPSAT